jgi:hypothetical protein
MGIHTLQTVTRTSRIGSPRVAPFTGRALILCIVGAVLAFTVLDFVEPAYASAAIAGALAIAWCLWLDRRA